MTQPQHGCDATRRRHRTARLGFGAAIILSVASCASSPHVTARASAAPSASPPVSSQATSSQNSGYVSFLGSDSGGDPPVPSVVFDAGTPRIIPAGRAPLRGETAAQGYGMGSGRVTTDQSRVRVAFIVENWSGSRVVHNSWSSGHTQQLLSEYPQLESFLATELKHGYRAGYKIEFMLRPGSLGETFSGPVILFLEVTGV